MKSATTTNFIVPGEDFFTADLDNGGVRLGMVANRALDVMPGHDLYDPIKALKTEEEVEDMFDKLIEAGLISL